MPASLTERSVASVPITLWEMCVASLLQPIKKAWSLCGSVSVKEAWSPFLSVTINKACLYLWHCH